VLKDLMFAKKILVEKSANLVVVRKERILYVGFSKGLNDLAKIVLKNPCMLEDSSIADRVVGKAAVIIYSINRAKSVYAQLLSKYGLEELKNGGIETYYDELVAYIEAPGGGICPFERLVLYLDDREEAYRALLERFKEVFVW